MGVLWGVNDVETTFEQISFYLPLKVVASYFGAVQTLKSLRKLRIRWALSFLLILYIMDHNNDMNLNLLQPYKKILDLSNDDDDVPFRF